MQQRDKRIAEMIIREVSHLLHLEMRDHRFRAVTLTHVQMSADLSFAKIYFTCEGSETEINATAKALNHAKGYFRSVLSDRIEMKYVPDLKFYYDENLARVERLEQLFNDIKK